ncbi:hypothetical protein FA13DRAFT_1770942 [Coprinellus micaceus]|uniref:F-box domain-containing protein n=1 Tax=Coprinellus micaceus TaxID=71717 RepID=A0A4Y7TTZ8_COPMI|nr:hypothetical protein FA13DRAFT_1770942 [Coprinellus micaceus]
MGFSTDAPIYPPIFITSPNLMTKLPCHPSSQGTLGKAKVTQVPRIVVWFNRAGTSPRELRLYSRRCTSKDCHLLDTDVHRLLTEGPKLDHLSLGCRGPHCFRRLLKALDAYDASLNLESAARPWNRLRSLEIEFDNTYWNPLYLTAHKQETLFLQLPSSITAFTLRLPAAAAPFQDPLISSMIGLNIPPELLERLSHFEIGCDWYGAHILAMLEHCRNVETLAICTYGEPMVYGEDDEPLLQRIEAGIYLPKLHTFQHRGGPDLHLLDHIIVPSIRELDVQVVDIDDFLKPEVGELFSSLYGFITREGSDAPRTLRNLHLRDIILPVNELSEILRILDSLTTLTLDNVNVNVASLFTVMQRLSTSTSSRGRPNGPCLPHLEVLQLLDLPIPSPDFSPLFKFFTLRGPHPCRVTVSFLRPSGVPNAKDVRNDWIVLPDSDDEGDRGPSTLEEYGISVSVVPQSEG